MDRETELRIALDELSQRYREEAKPIVDELAAIQARKPLPPLIIPEAMLDKRHFQGVPGFEALFKDDEE